MHCAAGLRVRDNVAKRGWLVQEADSEARTVLLCNLQSFQDSLSEIILEGVVMHGIAGLCMQQTFLVVQSCLFVLYQTDR